MTSEATRKGYLDDAELEIPFILESYRVGTPEFDFLMGVEHVWEGDR